MFNALLVTASIIVGAGGVQLLHAQSKAPAYFLGAINVKDQDGTPIPSCLRRKRRSRTTAASISAAGSRRQQSNWWRFNERTTTEPCRSDQV